MAKAKVSGSGWRGVVYYNHGDRCLARLVVSLYSLRRHYSGPVTILDSTTPTGDTSGASEILQRIVAEKRLGEVEYRSIPLVACRKNSAYVTKASLWRHSPYAITLFLDADTVVAKDPSALLGFAESESAGFVVTRFSSWVTTGDIVGARIARWRGVKCEGIEVGRLVKESLGTPHAAINTGVIAWRRGAAILAPWERLTMAGAKTPFTDELSCQILIREFPHTLVGEKFNASPIYTRTPPDQVVIYHQHGSKHVLRADGRGEQGHAIWWPLYEECVRENVAGIKEWSPAGDGRLADYLASVGADGAAA